MEHARYYMKPGRMVLYGNAVVASQARKGDIYTQLVDFKNPEECTCRVAKNLKQDQELIEAGFEYVTERDGLKIYRRQK